MQLKVYNKNNRAPKPNQPIAPGSCAVILSRTGRILLHKRNDSELWALPGGVMELGESIAACCLREIKEELNLKIKIKKITGVYTSPDCVFEWNVRGNIKVWQIFVVAFLCEAKNDMVKMNNESVDARWFSRREIEKINLLPYVKKIVNDALVQDGEVFFD
jgi:ADP-ribose pyrophosphatase YjhB (NUDIX family)